MRLFSLLLSLFLLFPFVLHPTSNLLGEEEASPFLFNKKQSYYEITEIIDLGGNTISLPIGATVAFHGGQIHNGKIVCNDNIFSGQSGIAEDVILSGTVRGPLDLNVFRLKPNDKSFDLGTVLNLAATVSKSIIVPEGIFFFQTPVLIENIRYYQQYGDLYYNGKSKDVIAVRFYDANAANISIYGKIAYDVGTKTINYSKTGRTNIIGIEFSNFNNSNVFVGDVEYFNNNIRVAAYGAGNSYNKYTFGISVFSNEHIRIFQKDLPLGRRG